MSFSFANVLDSIMVPENMNAAQRIAALPFTSPNANRSRTENAVMIALFMDSLVLNSIEISFLASVTRVDNM